MPWERKTRQVKSLITLQDAFLLRLLAKTGEDEVRFINRGKVRRSSHLQMYEVEVAHYLVSVQDP